MGFVIYKSDKINKKYLGYIFHGTCSRVGYIYFLVASCTLHTYRTLVALFNYEVCISRVWISQRKAKGNRKH